MAGMTQPTSSLSPPPLSQPEKTAPSKSDQNYQKTVQLPFELAQHVHVYFEESMFLQGFRLILSLISANASSRTERSISIPPPSYLALTSTISVHPSFTSRTTLAEKWEQANSARRVLRLLLRTAGPVNAKFARAFSFNKYNKASPEKDSSVNHSINSYYALEGSLWSRADDFWAVVGWAMNCSCLSGMHASRWEYWSLWLDFMLDVLETDWESHYANGTCEDSLIWQYVESAPGGTVRARRMLRAIFADGKDRSLNEFREVFRRELREPPNHAGQPKKREVDVDVEAEVYGDYMKRDDSDSMSESEMATANAIKTSLSENRPSKRMRLRATHRPSPKASGQSLYAEFNTSGATGMASSYENSTVNSEAVTLSSSSLGSTQASTIRLRLLHLLSHIAGHPTLTSSNPDAFPTLDELYTLYVEFIKPLPLHTFQQFISPHSAFHHRRHRHNGSESSSGTQIFSSDAHSTLCEFILQRTLESSAPSMHMENYLTVAKLADEYLPYAASKNHIDSNCRVSLLLEALLRQLKEENLLAEESQQPSEDGRTISKTTLMHAVEKGIHRRTEKVGGGPGGKFDNRKKKSGGGVVPETNQEEVLAWNWMVESGERMKMVVRSLKG